MLSGPQSSQRLRGSNRKAHAALGATWTVGMMWQVRFASTQVPAAERKVSWSPGSVGRCASHAAPLAACPVLALAHLKLPQPQPGCTSAPRQIPRIPQQTLRELPSVAAQACTVPFVRSTLTGACSLSLFKLRTGAGDAAITPRTAGAAAAAAAAEGAAAQELLGLDPEGLWSCMVMSAAFPAWLQADPEPHMLQVRAAHANPSMVGRA